MLNLDSGSGHRPGHRAAAARRASVLSCPGTSVSYLGEEVDAVGDGVHGERVSPDEEAPEVDPGQLVQPGVEAGQLPDVVADHVEQTLAHVLLGKL